MYTDILYVYINLPNIMDIGHNCETFRPNSKEEQVVNSEIKLGLPFMVPNLVYKFYIIC